jgi:hypothetical protein
MLDGGRAMATRVDVTIPEILNGYDALADIYSHVPPLIMWRAWEFAAYRRHRLTGPVLDDAALEAVGIPATFELCTQLVRPGAPGVADDGPARFTTVTWAFATGNCGTERIAGLAGELVMSANRADVERSGQLGFGG